MVSAGPDGAAVDRPGRTLPPVTEIGIATLAVIVASGVYLSAYPVPRHAPYPAAIALVALAYLGEAVNIVLLLRIRDFAWDKFVLVGRWALLAYSIAAGMLEYVFVRDHTPGRTLAILSLALVVFATDIPIMLAFTVARYQPVPD